MAAVLFNWLAIFIIVKAAHSLSTPGKPPVTLGRFPTTPTSTHLSSREFTKHPYFDLYKDPTPYYHQFTDPFWFKQWYAQDYRSVDMPVMDLNLVPVYWKGITGQHVTIAITGGGLDSSHRDLQRNFVEYLSYDTCTKSPGAAVSGSDDVQSTLAAGVIAMQPNNTECGVGVAYNARIAAVKFWCVWKEEIAKAAALTHRLGEVDIYNNGWAKSGFSPPSQLIDQAISQGVKNGRGFKGAIYVFSAGDDGDKGYTCAGNSQLNHYGVIGVNGASQIGKALTYGERCTSIFATAYAADPGVRSQGILSTVPGDGCVQYYKGTWSAAAFASGIIALILQANSELMYRDVMHIITMGSEVAPLADNDNSWQKNAAGFWVSRDFGFGLLNAQNLVELASNWLNVPELSPPCTVTQRINQKLSVGELKTFQFNMSNCKIVFAEHVIFNSTIKYPARGALQLYLTSPKGTNVTLLEPRLSDQNSKGLIAWSIKSLHTWGEDPRGTWTLQVVARDKPACLKMMMKNSEQIEWLSLDVHGTVNSPPHTGNLPRTYAGFYLRNYKSNDAAEEAKIFEILGSFPTKPHPFYFYNYEGVTKHPEIDVNMDPSAYRDRFKDPDWTKQWYVQDYRLLDSSVMDLNVVPAYKMGYIGTGVTIAIVDDGVDGSHPDLKTNFESSLSMDACLLERESAMPGADENYGTMAAGVIAMEPNNKMCGVGIAYGAKVAGIKMICEDDLPKDRKKESYSYSYKMASIDIYNSRPGPVMKPLSLATEVALENGLTAGRSRKGSIYVFSAGMKNKKGNNCAKRAHLNHYGVIGVNAASQAGKVLSYGEHCSAIFATTYAAEDNEQGIVTTIPGGKCKQQTGGTWSAGALASGIIALVLSANPELSYRDIMHIITMGSEVAPLADNAKTWNKNGRGFWVSNDFGFGLMNAENMVHLAKNWVNVPKLNICNENAFKKSWPYDIDNKLLFNFTMTACTETSPVFFLEQIELTVSIQHPYRGALQLYLKSPKGTKVTVLDEQLDDTSDDGFDKWRIKSVHFWGEDPRGVWQIETFAREISSGPKMLFSTRTGALSALRFTLYGTKTMPFHYYNQDREYSGFRLPDGRNSVVNDE